MNPITTILNLVAPTTQPDKRIRHARQLCAGVPFIDSDQVFAFASKQRPKIGLSTEEVEGATEFAKKYEIVHAGLMEYISETPMARFKKQRKSLTDLARQGDATAISKLRDADAWTIEQLEEDAKEVRLAYKTTLRGISADAIEFLKPAIARRTELLLDWMDERETEEIKEAAEVGVSFVASGPLRAIAWLACSVVNFQAHGIGQSPRKILHLLGYLTPEEKKAAEEARKLKAKVEAEAKAKVEAEEAAATALLSKQEAETKERRDKERQASAAIDRRIIEQDLERARAERAKIAK